MILYLLFFIIALNLLGFLALWLKKNKLELGDIFEKIQKSLFELKISLDIAEKSNKDSFALARAEFNTSAKDNRSELQASLESFQKRFVVELREISGIIEKHLKSIREDNTRQLDQIRKTVDEKLQTTLEKKIGESFRQVSLRLEQVHKGLGEMQSIASGVGDLKKVLTNVKTRGVLGEYQLENILEQILTPRQYEKNVATKKGSQAIVEFAIKLPGQDSDNCVWLPVDSKFPIEDYNLLLDAYDKGDKVKIQFAQNTLLRKIESFAKDISSKYLDPPNTTDFAVMFLPVEGLYAEVLRHPGLFDILQRKYKITITGPTTLSALLNSLQMGFRTLAVQKRSSQVWDILKSVKQEFGQFTSMLEKAHKQLGTASGTLESLITTRTNVLERKLRNVESFEGLSEQQILEIRQTNNEKTD